VFPVRYGLNFYILFRRNSVFKGLMVFGKDLKPFIAQVSPAFCYFIRVGSKYSRLIFDMLEN
jgi:hypothetical protein